MTIKTLVEDTRRIAGIFDRGGGGIMVGKEGVTKIITYYENGQCAKVPWFAVYEGKEIMQRYDAQGLLVKYFPTLERS